MASLTRKSRIYGLTILSVFAVSALAGCGGGDNPEKSSVSSFVPGGDISVVNANGCFYANSVNSPTNSLPIYAAKGKGDVPYVNVADFARVLASDPELQTVSYAKEGNNGVLASSASPTSKAIVDPTNNQFHLINYSNLLGSARMNNGFGRDYCLPTSQQAVKSSSKTNMPVKGEEDAIIKLDDYGLKIYRQGDSIYAPLELLNTVLNNASLEHNVFNGKDYFKGADNFKMPAISAFCYSGGGAFSYGWSSYGENFRINFRLTDPKQGEKYRFVSLDNTGQPNNVNFISILNDGTGKFLQVKDGKEEEMVFNGLNRRLFAEVKDQVMDLYILDVPAGGEGTASKESCTDLLKINMGKTRYGALTRSQEVADYNYGLLCLTFDKFYGNKEFKTSGSFDAYFTSKGMKESLKSTDIATYSETMFKFLAQDIGDGHTAMNTLSMYSLPDNATLEKYRAKYTSERVKKISEKALACQGARFNSFGHAYGEDFYEASKNTAMISFDLFALEGFPLSFRNYKGATARDLINRDACGFVAAAIMEIEERNKNPEATKIENIIIDLTANGGGAMPVMPYLAGIMTKDPVSRVKDQTSGRIVEYHYECDFDGDGTFGDTYADKFNFAVLVSSGSFSCATALPGMLKGTNVKILGEKSAGGASPVTHFTDGCGINYQTSGSNIMVYKEGEGKFTSIEEGTPVDYEIPEKDWYNLDVLDAKMKEIFAKA